MKPNLKSIETSEEEKILLGIIRQLETFPNDHETNEYILSGEKKVRTTTERLTAVSARRLKAQQNNCPKFLESLVQKKLLVYENEIFSLTDSGRNIGKKIVAKWSNEFYGDILIRSGNSKAHALFCERVYGKNLCQFNVMDMEQLEAMLDALNLQSDEYVLDLGCGLGKVDEYISTKTGARVLGVDFSKEAIYWAQEHTKSVNDKLTFQVGNINELSFPPSTFDVIVSIDTLYDWHVYDLNATIKKIKEILKPKGQIGIFAGQFRAPNEPLELLEPYSTKMAKILTANGMSFNIIDFTENSLNLWNRELSAAQELREMFEKEGNLDLFEERIEDSKQTKQLIKNKQQKRYFYHVQL
ncbi:MAG: class I SAM-dependent methyltransferase [Promethearchaeota archaeon]